jgi:hypothetical protein
MSSISGKSLFSPQVTFEEFCPGKSGRKRRTTPSDATHEIIVYGRSKTANVDVFVRKLVFMVRYHIWDKKRRAALFIQNSRFHHQNEG